MYLYELNYRDYQGTPSELTAREKKVSIFSTALEGEKCSIKTHLRRLVFLVLSKGCFWIYYVNDAATGCIIHTSYVMGHSIKFPFMGKTDLHICPCYTAPAYRGNGIYRNVLRFIHNVKQHTYNRAYMIVSENNLPSIKGIEAAGFKRIGSVQRIKLLKRYRRICND